MNTFFAVDLGATSGRTILATLEMGTLTTTELTRFKNTIHQVKGHCYWDIYTLHNEIVRGLKAAKATGAEITSIGIDTWGVDIVCIAGDGDILRAPRSYRDPCTVEAMDDFFENVMDKKTLYQKTGIQVMNFNTVFQLHAMRKEGNSALENADTILFLPDALSYLLCGEKVCEYTIASTSGMLNPHTREFDEDILKALNLERGQFGRMVMPGEKIGVLTEDIQQLTGLPAVPVIAVAGHDTASAVAAVPAKDKNFAYLSSGTWSLMGVEVPEPVITEETYDLNFTNEGGADGSIRVLKNICGMWLLESCRREWGDTVPQDHPTLIKAAQECEAFRSIIYPDDPVFANPASMITAIQEYCINTNQPIPETYGQFCRCIFDSLALRYKEVYASLCKLRGKPCDALHIIGGGSLNNYLNQLTADACDVKVLAGPQECTAIGNIMFQALAAGIVSDMIGLRHIISNNFQIQEFTPRRTEMWNNALEAYHHLLGIEG